MNAWKGKRYRVLSADERVLWTAVTQSIVPLDEKQKSKIEKPETTKSQTKLKPTQLPRSNMGANKAAESTTAILPPLAPLERRMRRRLVQGQETIDARLDLHGLAQAEAYAALLHFLRTASVRGARLVLIITGKGSRGLNRGESGGGVLRRQVPQWLATPDFRDLVIGFEDAHIIHGGEGALYVRVRRSR